MAVGVFPQRMDRVDPSDPAGSLRMMEDYIRYMTERVEFSVTNHARNLRKQEVGVEEIAAALPMCSVGMTEDEEWITVLVDEEKRKVMDVLNQIQNSYRVRDMQLEEISTEEVIRKIYEDSAAEREKAKNTASADENASEGGGAK